MNSEVQRHDRITSRSIWDILGEDTTSAVHLTIVIVYATNGICKASITIVFYIYSQHHYAVTIISTYKGLQIITCIIIVNSIDLPQNPWGNGRMAQSYFITITRSIIFTKCTWSWIKINCRTWNMPLKYKAPFGSIDSDSSFQNSSPRSFAPIKNCLKHQVLTYKYPNFLMMPKRS